MEYRLIKCERHFDNAVFKIVLNAPKANVLEAAMLKRSCTSWTQLEKDKDLKFIVFEGEGKHFSFGASVPEHTKENAAMMLNAFHGMFYQLVKLAVPTMAVVRGQCLGGGMELALFCNFIVADSTAVFGQPEIVLGVFPPPASVMLPLKIGQTYADDLALSGRSVTGAEAHQIGLVNMLVGEGQDAWEVGTRGAEKHILPKERVVSSDRQQSGQDGILP